MKKLQGKSHVQHTVLRDPFQDLSCTFARRGHLWVFEQASKDSEKQSNKTSISLTEGEVTVETTGKVTVKAKQNVSCTVEEGDIECKCKNLTATVEKDTKCTCENLTAEVKSNANVKAQTINLEGNVNIKGNLNVDGNTDCSGNVTGSAVQAGGIDLAGHVHGGVEPGGGTTGGAQ